MVNILRSIGGRDGLRTASALVGFYVAIVVGTVVALAILSVVSPRSATADAWVHAVIVAVFAVVLPLRLRAARRGGRGPLRAVGIISAVLFVVNVVEAMIPALFPLWMRIEMVVIALTMAAVILLVVRQALVAAPERHGTV